MTKEPLKIVTFNFVNSSYNVVTDWIHRHGHKHVLAVTTPGPKSRPTPEYKEIVTKAPRDVDILVTTRLRKVATPLIRALEPDLIVCFSFPYRITPELCEIPRYGAVNLHPAALPAYRGINVFRAIYDGEDFGATLHWIAPDFDTGNILSKKSAPLPEDAIVDNIAPVWWGLIHDTLEEGIALALTGDPGIPQDDSLATEAAVFTEEEAWLDLNDSQRVLQRKVTGLSFMVQPKLKMGDEQFVVTAVELLPQGNETAVGQLIGRGEGTITAQAADGPVCFQVTPLES